MRRRNATGTRLGELGDKATRVTPPNRGAQLNSLPKLVVPAGYLLDFPFFIHWIIPPTGILSHPVPVECDAGLLFSG